jgi:hypothetical protein
MKKTIVRSENAKNYQQLALEYINNIRAGIEVQNNMNLLFELVQKVIYRWGKDDEELRSKLMSETFMKCVEKYDINSNAMFSTYLWRACQRESFNFYNDNSLPLSDEDKEIIAKDCVDNYIATKCSMESPVYDDVYIMTGDCVFNAMLKEELPIMESEYSDEMKWHYMKLDGMTDAEIGKLFDMSQQGINKRMGIFYAKFGVTYRKATKCKINKSKIEWDAIRRYTDFHTTGHAPYDTLRLRDNR